MMMAKDPLYRDLWWRPINTLTQSPFEPLPDSHVITPDAPGDPEGDLGEEGDLRKCILLRQKQIETEC